MSIRVSTKPGPEDEAPIGVLALPEAILGADGPPRSIAIVGTRGYPSYYGGFETAIRHIAPYLADLGWEVTVYGRKGWVRHDDPDRDHRVISVNVWQIPTKSLSTLSAGFSAAIKVFCRRPDVALIMNVANGVWLPIYRLRGIPTLVHVDGIEWERAKWGLVARSVFLLGANVSKRLATRLVYDAKEIAKRWKDRFKRDGFLISYGGIPVVDKLPAPLGLTNGEFILVVARLVPENSIREFLAALDHVKTEIRIVVVGSAGNRSVLEGEVAEKSRVDSRVTWLGHVNDDALLFALWQNCGAYFHGHTVGGTNPALVQAMALGTPIVAIRTKFNEEVLGDSGVLVDRDPEKIAEALNRLVKDPELRLRKSVAASDRAQRLYTWSSVCRQYALALIATIAANVDPSEDETRANTR